MLAAILYVCKKDESSSNPPVECVRQSTLDDLNRGRGVTGNIEEDGSVNLSYPSGLTPALNVRIPASPSGEEPDLSALVTLEFEFKEGPSGTFRANQRTREEVTRILKGRK